MSTTIPQGALTAMARKVPSAPAQWLHSQGLLKGRCLDFGCGRGKDAETYEMTAYDPYWANNYPTGTFDTLTCLYVLNVVDLPTQEQILEEIRALLAPGGTAYICVRRDLPKAGKAGRGCWQRYVVLDAPTAKLSSGRWVLYSIQKEACKLAA